MPTTTVTNALPQWLQDYMATAAQRGLAIGNMPFQPYGGQMVAPLSPAQQAGIDMIQARATSGSPLMQNAQNQLNSIIGGSYLPGNNVKGMSTGGGFGWDSNPILWSGQSSMQPQTASGVKGASHVDLNNANTSPQSLAGLFSGNSSIGQPTAAAPGTRNTSLDMAPFSQQPGSVKGMATTDWSNANTSPQSLGSIFPGGSGGGNAAFMPTTPGTQQWSNPGMQSSQPLGGAQGGSPGGSNGGNPFYGTVANLANGGGLGGNPYLSGIMQTTQNDVQSRMGQLGYGSGSFGNSGVQSTAARELANSANALQYQNYNDARNQQMQALGLGSGMYESERARQMQALGMAPGMAQSDYYDAAQLLGAGSLQRGVNQDINQANYNEFIRGQNWPFQTQDAFLRSIGFNPGSTQSTTSPDPNQAAQYLGYGIGALGLANLGTSLWDWWGS